MGDDTTERIFSTTPEAGLALREALVAGADQRVFDAMTRVAGAAGQTTEFRGKSYDHALQLPHLVEAYGTGAVDPLPRYTHVARLRLRLLTSGDADQQATGILNMLAQAQNAPERLLPILKEDLRRSFQLAKDVLAARTGPAATQSRAQRADAVARASDALRGFAMTVAEVLRVIDLAPIGGFFPGAVPAELSALNDRHTPVAGGLLGLARGIGFVKTLVEPYEAAGRSGQDIVHLQTYGA